MRRSLAILAAVIAVAATPARASEPLDLDLRLLGAPDPAIWRTVGGVADPLASALAADSRARFGRLATDLALGLTSTLLQPASTTGHSGFAFDFEVANTVIAPEVVGTGVTGSGAAAYPRPYWPTRSMQPHELLTPAFHVRKGFPFSTELGGTFTYLSQSSYFAAQLEGKVTLIESYSYSPDVALRAAWTKVLGQRDLDLSVSEFDLLVSRRFGANAVVSFTPYLAARYSVLHASTKVMSFLPDTLSDPTPPTPAEIAASSAAYPNVGSTLYRTTLGVRMTSFAVSMAAEATYFAGATFGKASPGAGDYPQFKVPSSLSTAFKFGFEF
jgi:hypothetical protein